MCLARMLRMHDFLAGTAWYLATCKAEDAQHPISGKIAQADGRMRVASLLEYRTCSVSCPPLVSPYSSVN